jgi:hypothetical protein
MALSWPNLPCALRAAIGIGKRTSGNPRQSAAQQGPLCLIGYPGAHDGPSGGVADSLDEAQAAFRRLTRPCSHREETESAANGSRSSGHASKFSAMSRC